MPSPDLVSEYNRLWPERPLISAHADHKPDHYRFQRTQALYTPSLQRIRPQESWLSLIVMFGLVAFSCIMLTIAASGAIEMLSGPLK